ncbi:AAA family ATPase [Microbacterium marinilacus]|uniref:ATPase n=1 Tax=Microbacterium marinilacus TaxID=415209 RepID=A0ABP7BGQ5_9MICO|nr:AAA family ATPase [Microbacterium marinilacus]MBY0689603.1 AAA family ATPase [Microbacterium marinilacus]
MGGSDDPALLATVHEDGSARIVAGEAVTEFGTSTIDAGREAVMLHTIALAAERGLPVRVRVTEPDGVWPLVVSASGEVEPDQDVPEEQPPAPASRGEGSGTGSPVPSTPYDLDDDDSDVVDDPSDDSPARRRREAPQPAAPAPVPRSAAIDDRATAGADALVADVAAVPPAAASPTPGPTTRPGARRGGAADGRRSFLTPERLEEPASRGWRGALIRLGMRMSPNAAERAERADMSTVSQHWPGPRTIAIVNGKGGSGKTPTTILTAAVFARYGGVGVLAWDNNQTRGTLGWRTEQGPHDASLHDLLPETERLLSASAQSADLARYVHHQTRDRYDVLRSRPVLLAHEQRVEREDVDRIHAVAAKYYRLIVMDSGNDESDPMWRQMIERTDQLVVATTTRAEHAEAGALLLEALAERDERSAALVRGSVAVVSQADQYAQASDVRNVVEGYEALSREVVAIPYDPAMTGGFLHYGALRPATQRAWLAATAAIARGLGPQAS